MELDELVCRMYVMDLHSYDHLEVGMDVLRSNGEWVQIKMN